jgi:hypothetical protein
MGDEQSSWSTLAKVLTGIAGLITAIATFYATVYKPDTHPKEGSVPALVQAMPVNSQPAAAGPASPSVQTASSLSLATRPVETIPTTPNVTGSWQMRGNFQNGTPYAGQIDFASNSFFQMGAQGVTTASGSWSWDASSRNLVLDGQHNLYGYPLQFRCALGATPQDNSAWSGQCRDQTGIGTIQLTRY